MGSYGVLKSGPIALQSRHKVRKAVYPRDVATRVLRDEVPILEPQHSRTVVKAVSGRARHGNLFSQVQMFTAKQTVGSFWSMIGSASVSVAC